MLNKMILCFVGVLVFVVVFLALQHQADKNAIELLSNKLNALSAEKMALMETMEGYEYARKVSQKRIEGLESVIAGDKTASNWFNVNVPTGVARSLRKNRNANRKNKAN